MKPRLAFLVLGLAAIAILSYVLRAALFSAPSDSAAGAGIPITASFYPLAEFAQEIGKERVSVRNLTPVGVEPHDFDPSPRDLASLQRSKVFVYNGAGFEPWADKVLDLLPEDGPVVVDSSAGIQLLWRSGEEAAQDQVKAGARYDPHFWLDPRLAKQQVENIKAGLIEADVANADRYERNASIYNGKLDELDKQFRDALADCKRRDIVTSHNAFQYLARRYNLNVVAVAGLSPDEEPSPMRLAEIVQFARANDVRYIFFETLVSPRLAATIATEVGAQVLVFNPIEGLTGSELAAGQNYLSVQRQNLSNLKTALECR